MATSTIFSNVKITDPKNAEIFADALESSANDTPKKTTTPRIPLVTNIDEIKKFMTAGFLKE